MAYATIADLEGRMEVSDLEAAANATQGSADYTARLQAVLDHASAEIDSYARVRYEVPLLQSERLEQLALDIAVYRIELRHATVRESDRAAYMDAVKFLAALARGEVGLDSPAAGGEQAAGGEVKANTALKIFTDDNLQGY